MAASEYDLELIARCLQNETHAWEDFVDRSVKPVMRVLLHTTRSRGIQLSPADGDDLVAEVFLELCRNDFACLRRFRGQSSFNAYLTVIARRVIVRDLSKRPHLTLVSPDPTAWSIADQAEPTASPNPADGGEPFEDLMQLLRKLDETESRLIQLHHLEGYSYQQISQETGISENSIGPALSRAREKMRQEHHRQKAA